MLFGPIQARVMLLSFGFVNFKAIEHQCLFVSLI